MSEFFRDLEFFAYLRDELIFKLSSFPIIKVWSVGCANGQEAYSLAILFKEYGLLQRCQIYATDIDEEALKRAKDGVFSKDEFVRGLENYYLSGGKERFSSYFKEKNCQFEIAKELKRSVYFEKHDILTDGVFNEFSLIVCKNLLLYIEENKRELLFKNLKESLCSLGYLSFGECDGVKENDLGEKMEYGDKIFKNVRVPPPIHKI